MFILFSITLSGTDTHFGPSVAKTIAFHGCNFDSCSCPKGLHRTDAVMMWLPVEAIYWTDVKTFG